MTESEKEDLEFFRKRAEEMRKSIDYSNAGRQKVECGKTYVVKQLMDRIDFPYKMTKLEKHKLLASILTCCEDIQEEAFLRGEGIIYTLNGYLKKTEVKARTRRYSDSLNQKWLPPKYKIVYQPGMRVKTLNKALERMSYKDVPTEMLEKTKEEIYKEFIEQDEKTEN